MLLTTRYALYKHDCMLKNVSKSSNSSGHTQQRYSKMHSIKLTVVVLLIALLFTAQCQGNGEGGVHMYMLTYLYHNAVIIHTHCVEL